jgi:formylmethanofuran dehydrogenase subunit D
LPAKTSKLSVTLLTGRTIDQGTSKEHGKSSDEYMENVAACFVDSVDLKRLGMKYNANVCVSTEYGSVVLKVLKSQRGPHPGVIFIPYGPWANRIVSPVTDDIGMPSFKGIPASIEPAPTEKVLGLRELLTQQFGKE